MKAAMYYKKLAGKAVQCRLCPKYCRLKEQEWGNCNARKNIGGKLYSMVYGMACAIAIDPIEKKPLFHFYPGSKVFSIGTAGCNLHCKFCQNYTTAQTKADEIPCQEITPEEIVSAAERAGCESIGYTYNEPYIFYEFVLETAKLARKKGLKNIMVTNGFCNPEPVGELYTYIDAANIDLKGFSEEFYKEYCDAKLRPVLNTIKQVKEMGVHVELTNLIIPGLNDTDQMLTKLCSWVEKTCGKDQVMHFSRFHPCYKLNNIEPTPSKTLLKAREIAKKTGLHYVYIGNIRVDAGETTFCPNCNKKLISREGFFITENTLNKNNCSECKTKITGVF